MVEVLNANVEQASFIGKCHSQRQISLGRWPCPATNIGNLPTPASRVDLDVQLNWSHDINVPLSVEKRVVVGRRHIL